MSLRAFRRTSTALAALLFTLATAPAFAQLPEMPLGKWWKRPRVVERLKLKPDQQERLDEIFGKNRRSFIDLKADVDRRAVDLEELLMKKESDPARISAATDALEQARARLGKTRTMMIVEMKGVLSGDQWQRILELRDEWRRERFEERHGGAGGPQHVLPPGRGDKGNPTVPTPRE
ncbi:MAG TPA: periplasmic heavy metal sensor [Thermoanaerobaculia bacterium]